MRRMTRTLLSRFSSAQEAPFFSITASRVSSAIAAVLLASSGEDATSSTQSAYARSL